MVKHVSGINVKELTRRTRSVAAARRLIYLCLVFAYFDCGSSCLSATKSPWCAGSVAVERQYSAHTVYSACILANKLALKFLCSPWWLTADQYPLASSFSQVSHKWLFYVKASDRRRINGALFMWVGFLMHFGRHGAVGTLCRKYVGLDWTDMLQRFNDVVDACTQ